MNKSAQSMTEEEINVLIDALVEYGIVELIGQETGQKDNNFADKIR